MCEKYTVFDEFNPIFYLESPSDIDKLFSEISDSDNDFICFCPPEYNTISDGIYQRVKHLLELFFVSCYCSL